MFNLESDLFLVLIDTFGEMYVGSIKPEVLDLDVEVLDHVPNGLFYTSRPGSHWAGVRTRDFVPFEELSAFHAAFIRNTELEWD